jgi:hypothetical protein
MNRLFILLFLFSLAACQGANQNQGDQTNQESTSSETAATPPTEQGEQLYPSIPLDTLMMLYEQCDFIDYVFYYTNFSVSQNQKADIQSSIRYISEEVPAINPNCKAQGRLFFQIEGENRMEADLIFESGCTYYLFYQDGKPAYANKLMPGGITFYNNIFNSVQGQ